MLGSKHCFCCQSRDNPLAWGSGHTCPNCDIKQWRYLYGPTTCPNCGHVVDYYTQDNKERKKHDIYST